MDKKVKDAILHWAKAEQLSDWQRKMLPRARKAVLMSWIQQRGITVLDDHYFENSDLVDLVGIDPEHPKEIYLAKVVVYQGGTEADFENLPADPKLTAEDRAAIKEIAEQIDQSQPNYEFESFAFAFETVFVNADNSALLRTHRVGEDDCAADESQLDSDIPDYIATEKDLSVATQFLLRRGYTIQDIDPALASPVVDIVASDDSSQDLAFVKVVKTDKPNSVNLMLSPTNRAKRESFACRYLAQHPEIDNCKIRFDEIELISPSSDRCLIRHYINCGAAC